MPSSPRPIALIGLMGSGKSRVGRMLARQLDVGFVDLDRAIAKRAGKSITRIFEEQDESEFRRLENELLAETLGGGMGVIACGGGVVESSSNIELLRSGAEVVFLDVSVATARRRIGEGDSRPLAGNLEEINVRRRPLYLAAAEHIVDANRSAKETALLIARALAL